ncbi:MAG: EamA family transporter [Euryarchaeota archaeon]|nr:EamA family transporter [Euryarchaeota archaeon]
MRERDSAIALTLLSSFFWGSSFVAADYGVRILHPVLYLALRFAIAAPMGVALVWHSREGMRNVMGDWRIWALGALNAVAFAMQYVGLEYTTATKAALLVHMNIVIVAILSVVLMRERMSWKIGLAVVVGTAGVSLVSIGDAMASPGGLASIWQGGSIVGDLLNVGAGCVWAFFIIFTKKVLNDPARKRSPDAVTGALAMTTLLPLSLMSLAFPWGGTPSTDIILLATYLAFFCTILAYLLWSCGLKHLSATATSLLVLMELLFAAILAAILLGDTLTPVSWAGAGLIAVAAVLAALSESNKGISPIKDAVNRNPP